MNPTASRDKKHGENSAFYKKVVTLSVYANILLFNKQKN